MKFVADLGKGILGTADSPELWSDIVGRYPDEMLTDPDAKFLNLACGHLTEACLLVKRMMALGVSVQEANSKIYVLDKYSTFTNAAKMQGYQNVIQADFTEWETDMKFDVVVGNPPYQKENNQNGKLYPSFYLKSHELIKDNGYVAFITPSAWLKRAALIFNKMRENILNNDVKVINMDAGNFFNVGESICYFITQKSKTNINTKVILDSKEYSVNLNDTIELVLTEEDKLWKSINDKVTNSSLPKITWQEDVHDHQKKLIESGVISKTKTQEHIYPIYYTASQKQYANHLFGDKDHLKVMINLSGHWHSKKTPWKYIRITRAMTGQGTLHINCKDKNQAKSVKSFLTSNLYHFWVNKVKTSGFNTGLSKLPMLDTNKIWTNKEIYNVFNLTQKEIEYIEKNI